MTKLLLKALFPAQFSFSAPAWEFLVIVIRSRAKLCCTGQLCFTTSAVECLLVPDVFIRHHEGFAQRLCGVEPDSGVLLHRGGQLTRDGSRAGVQGAR